MTRKLFFTFGRCNSFTFSSLQSYYSESCLVWFYLDWILLKFFRLYRRFPSRNPGSLHRPLAQAACCRMSAEGFSRILGRFTVSPFSGPKLCHIYLALVQCLLSIFSHVNVLSRPMAWTKLLLDILICFEQNLVQFLLFALSFLFRLIYINRIQKSLIDRIFLYQRVTTFGLV